MKLGAETLEVLDRLAVDAHFSELPARTRRDLQFALGLIEALRDMADAPVPVEERLKRLDERITALEAWREWRDPPKAAPILPVLTYLKDRLKEITDPREHSLEDRAAGATDCWCTLPHQRHFGPCEACVLRDLIDSLEVKP